MQKYSQGKQASTRDSKRYPSLVLHLEIELQMNSWKYNFYQRLPYEDHEEEQGQTAQWH